ILFGLGNATFQIQMKYDVDREPSHVMADDFNNDNKMDIAVVGRLSHNMQVLFGDGNMIFSSRKRYGTSSSPGPAVAYDFNKDGKTDIAVLNKLSNILYIFLNECS
ncbi:unnamed protein product, partial [Rotaria sp. Silwood1]